MKAMVCELCGSNEFIKQDGMFVCQHCNTNYTPEEAKKLLGTVKIDESEKIKNFQTMAENAYDSGNNKEAESYCNKIIEIEPHNTEAWLLKGITSAWQSTLANNRMEELISCSDNAFKNAKSVEELNNLAERAYSEFYRLTLAFNKLWIDHVVSIPNSWPKYLQFPRLYVKNKLMIQVNYGQKFNSFYSDKPEEEKVKPNSLSEATGLDDLNERCKSEVIDGSTKVWSNALREYKSNNGHPTDYDLNKMIEEGFAAKSMLEYVIPKDISKSTEQEKPNIIRACKNLILMETIWMDLKSYKVDFSGGYEHYNVSKSFNQQAKSESAAAIRKYHGIIKYCDPSYEVPVVPEPNATTGGCYVATAVYGSYDCPQVWTLRRYRDDMLAKTWYGRAFIRTYYVVSPTLVKWFGKTDWFRNIWKPKLDRMVIKLNTSGVEDTPYQDKVW